MSITIGIPVFNADLYIEDALRSVFAQTLEDWELILIDDGSTDGSLEIMRCVADSRVTVVSDGDRRGLPARLNQIAALSRRPFIARMDADDLMSPNRLERQVAFLQERRDLDLVSTAIYSANNDLDLVGVRGECYGSFTLNDILFGKKGFCHAALVARRDWYARNSYREDIKGFEDLELWARAITREDFRAETLDEPLYVYREEGNITPQKMLRGYAGEREVMAQFLPSRAERWAYVGRSWIKTARAKIMSPRRIHESRNRVQVSAAERAGYARLIEQVKATRVPGL